MKAVLIVLLMLVPAGCTTEDVAMQAAEDDAYCRSLSAVPGTDAYVNCRFVLDQRRRAAQCAAGEVIGEAIGKSL